MPLFHFHVAQIRRSKGQSVVACVAYRAGEKLHSEYYGEDSDYTRKDGVVCSEILLPSHAPAEYADRETLWNAVEKAEPHPKAQLAYSFDIVGLSRRQKSMLTSLPLMPTRYMNWCPRSMWTRRTRAAASGGSTSTSNTTGLVSFRWMN